MPKARNNPVQEAPEVMRECCTCRALYARTLEHWSPDKRRADGLSIRCRKCASRATMRSRAAKRGPT